MGKNKLKYSLASPQITFAQWTAFSNTYSTA